MLGARSRPPYYHRLFYSYVARNPPVIFFLFHVPVSAASRIRKQDCSVDLHLVPPNNFLLSSAFPHISRMDVHTIHMLTDFQTCLLREDESRNGAVSCTRAEKTARSVFQLGNHPYPPLIPSLLFLLLKGSVESLGLCEQAVPRPSASRLGEGRHRRSATGDGQRQARATLSRGRSVGVAVGE